ncbi:MAG: hypothetical protein WED05_11795 [Candidatus Atabeyarchaeum deiterrae]
MNRSFVERNLGSPLIDNEMKDYEREIARLKDELVSNYFSPEEIRGIICNVREALTRLAEQASFDQCCLIRDLTVKLEELTMVMQAKSRWDKRLSTGAH